MARRRFAGESRSDHIAYYNAYKVHTYSTYLYTHNSIEEQKLWSFQTGGAFVFPCRSGKGVESKEAFAGEISYLTAH